VKPVWKISFTLCTCSSGTVGFVTSCQNHQKAAQPLAVIKFTSIWIYKVWKL